MKLPTWKKSANARAQQIANDFDKLVRMYEYELSNASKNMVARRISSAFTTNVARRKNRLTKQNNRAILAQYGVSNNQRRNQRRLTKVRPTSWPPSTNGSGSTSGRSNTSASNYRSNYTSNYKPQNRPKGYNAMRNTRYATRSTNERRVN